MFGKLPELFNRDFVVGYFLPTITFIVCSLLLLGKFGLLPNSLVPDAANQIDVLIGTTIIGLISWLLSVLLLATNRDIIRLMGGYGRFNPTCLLSVIEKRRYLALLQEKEDIDKKYNTAVSQNQDFPAELRRERNRLSQKIAERFPDDETWLLPTSFGNTIRAFEVYSRKMYGLGSIQGWSRLLSVLPEEFRNAVDASKAIVDFWVNLCFLCLVIIIEYLILILRSHQMILIWFPLVALAIAVISYYRAKSAAISWGGLIKSAFDVYLPDLWKKLGFSPKSSEDEIALWHKFSQAIIYAHPESMPKRSYGENNEGK